MAVVGTLDQEAAGVTLYALALEIVAVTTSNFVVSLLPIEATH